MSYYERGEQRRIEDIPLAYICSGCGDIYGQMAHHCPPQPRSNGHTVKDDADEHRWYGHEAKMHHAAWRAS